MLGVFEVVFWGVSWVFWDWFGDCSAVWAVFWDSGADWVVFEEMGVVLGVAESWVSLFNFSISSLNFASKYFLLHLSSTLHSNSKFSSTMQPTYLPEDDLTHNGSGLPIVSRK